MLKDITIGQYFPGSSVIHRMDPRMKLILTVGYVVALFLANTLWGLLICAAFLFFVYPLSQIPAHMLLKSLKPILPVVLFTALLNAFFVDGNSLFELWIFKITDRGLFLAGLMLVRVVCLIAGTSLLTYTTSPIMLTDGIEQLFAPLSKIKVPVHEIAMMMTIALRFIPTLIEETGKIMAAQKARGADMESGNFLQRIHALTPILIPLFVSAFTRAAELALAMECRCYHGGEGRTHLHRLRMSRIDAAAALFTACFIAGVILTNILFPGVF